jgi:hypothetical protein
MIRSAVATLLPPNFCTKRGTVTFSPEFAEQNGAGG